MTSPDAVRWVDGAAAFGEVVDALAAEPAYAIDTEFHRERTYYPHLALLQLAWPGGIALVDPLRVPIAPLRAALEGDGVAVAHAAEQDLEILERACGTGPRRLFDTQLAASFMGFSSPSLGQLVSAVLGVQLPKGDRLTDWTRRPLDPTQRAYAAADVAHLLALRDHMVPELSSAGRLAWVEQECELARQRRRGVIDTDTAWWRVKETRHLRGRARAVAQAVAAWRERTAEATDRPPRYVLPDMAVMTIASHPPETLDDLRAIRGVDARYLKGGVGREILAAVRAGLEMDAADVRSPPVDDVPRELRPAIALASAWVAQLSVDLRIDAALLATRADVTALIRGDEDARLATGWRAELVGEPLRRLVSGDAALAFAGRGRLVLEERSGAPVSDPG